MVEKEVKTEIKEIEIEKLKLNPYNPNVMSKKDFQYLKENIKKYGFLEFPVVAEVDGEYWVLDGAHRILALKELGYEKVKCIVVKGLPKVAVFLAPLTFNKPRGRLKSELVKELLEKGLEEFAYEEVKEWSGLTERAIKEYLACESGVCVCESTTVEERIIEEEEEVRSEPVPQVIHLIIPIPAELYDTVVKKLKEIDNDLGKALLKLLNLA